MMFTMDWNRARRGVIWSCLAVCLLAPAGASAQAILRYQLGGATALSAAIYAQADSMRAQGSYLVSSATARRINAQAVEQELKNAEAWVHTYFERRRANREYRQVEDPSYLERLEIRNKAYAQLVATSPETVMGGDATGILNWMVKDLLAHSSYQVFLPDYPQSLLESPDNIQLSDVEKHHLRLSEGNKTNGKTLAFRADTAQMLETRWPLALRRNDSTRPGPASKRHATTPWPS